MKSFFATAPPSFLFLIPRSFVFFERPALAGRTPNVHHKRLT